MYCIRRQSVYLLRSNSFFFFVPVVFFIFIFIIIICPYSVKALFPTQFPFSFSRQPSRIRSRRRITNWEPEFGPWGSLGRRRNDYYPVPDPRRCRKTWARPVTNGLCKATSGWHNPPPIISTPAMVTLAVIRLFVEIFFKHPKVKCTITEKGPGNRRPWEGQGCSVPPNPGRYRWVFF